MYYSALSGFVESCEEAPHHNECNRMPNELVNTKARPTCELQCARTIHIII